MQAKKETLYMKDADGQEYACYPKTLTECVTNQNGDNVEDALKSLISDELDIERKAIEKSIAFSFLV